MFQVKKYLLIEIWLSCFYVFVGVYISRCFYEVFVFMKYGEVVQDLVVRGGNWKFQDENFCFLR